MFFKGSKPIEKTVGFKVAFSHNPSLDPSNLDRVIAEEARKAQSELREFCPGADKRDCRGSFEVVAEMSTFLVSATCPSYGSPDCDLTRTSVRDFSNRLIDGVSSAAETQLEPAPEE